MLADPPVPVCSRRISSDSAAQDADPGADVVGVDGDGVAEGAGLPRVHPLGAEARRGADQRAVAQPPRPGPGRPEGGAVDDDDARVHVPQRLVVQAEGLDDPGLEVGQHDVGAGRQPADQLPALGVAQVDADRPLVAVPGRVALGHRRRQRAPRAVGEGRVLHLDDVGPEVAEDAAGVAADHDDPEVEHADAVQRQPRPAGAAPAEQGRLPQPGGRSALSRGEGAGAGAVDLHHPRRHRHGQPRRQLGRAQEAARLDLVGHQRLVQGEDGRGGHPVLLARYLQVGPGLAGEEAADRRQQGGRLEPDQDAVVLGVGELLRLAHPGEHAPPLPRGEHADAHVAVGTGNDRVPLPGLRAAALLIAERDAGRGAAGDPERRVEGLGGPVEDGEVDEVAPPGSQPVDVGGHGDHRGLGRGDVVGQVAGRDERVPVRDPRPGQLAGQRVEHRPGALPAAEPVTAAEVADAGDHQLRVPLADGAGIEGDLGHRPRPGGLDEDVRPGQQLLPGLMAIARGRVDDALVQAGLADGGAERDAVDDRADRVAPGDAGQRHQRDVRPEVGQEAADGGHRPAGQVDDLDPGQRRPVSGSGHVSSGARRGTGCACRSRAPWAGRGRARR